MGLIVGPATLPGAAWAAQPATAPSAGALWTALPTDALPQALTLVQQAAQALAPAGARVEVLPGAPDPRLRLAPCARVQAHLPTQRSPWGATRVGLRCINGPVAWNIFLPMTVHIWAPAWVARVDLPAGATVDTGALTMGIVDWAASASPPHAQDQSPLLLGRTLARAVAAGQAPRAADLQQRRWFSAGQDVRIVMQGPGFSVIARGQALNDGVEGRLTRVRTESGRVLSGLPVAEQQLLVNL